MLQSSEQSGKNFSDLIIENLTELHENVPSTESPTLDFTPVEDSEFIAQKLNQFDVEFGYQRIVSREGILSWQWIVKDVKLWSIYIFLK